VTPRPCLACLPPRELAEALAAAHRRPLHGGAVDVIDRAVVFIDETWIARGAASLVLASSWTEP
jgi:hypothetical protein